MSLAQMIVSTRVIGFAKAGTLASCLILAACSSDPGTFVSYGQRHGSGGVRFDPNKAPRRTDALALNYANSIEEIFRARSTGARYSREASDTALVGLAAFTAAAGTLDIGATKLAKMGMASAGILEFRKIFDARGRSTAYFEAAERIHAAIKDFGANNLNNVSETELTPNGWTLVNVVQSNIDIVNKILNGHLPSPEALAQASEAMTEEGATSQPTGSTPKNNIPAGELMPLPEKRPVRHVTEVQESEMRKQTTLESVPAVVQLKREIKALRQAAFLKAGKDPNFYSNALRAVKMQVKDGVTLAEYQRGVDLLTDLEQLGNLRAYFLSLLGEDSVDDSQADLERLRALVKASLGAVPTAQKNVEGFYPNLLIAIGDADQNVVTEVSFLAHVDQMTNPAKLRRLKSVLDTSR